MCGISYISCLNIVMGEVSLCIFLQVLERKNMEYLLSLTLISSCIGTATPDTMPCFILRTVVCVCVCVCVLEAIHPIVFGVILPQTFQSFLLPYMASKIFYFKCIDLLLFTLCVCVCGVVCVCVCVCV